MNETKTRRRGAKLEHAILDATWAELREVGYAALTMEGVATRAHTSKPVLYRRWSNRAELVLAAWSQQAPHSPEPIDTGALRTDLVALFRAIVRRSDRMSTSLMAGVMTEAFHHPEVIEVLRNRLRTASLEIVETIVRRAVDRGELPQLDLPPRVMRLPMDLVRAEAMMGGLVPEESVDELVDQVYLPLLHGLATADTRVREELTWAVNAP